jgi:hypothetical protein
VLRCSTKQVVGVDAQGSKPFLQPPGLRNLEKSLVEAEASEYILSLCGLLHFLWASQCGVIRCHLVTAACLSK